VSGVDGAPGTRFVDFIVFIDFDGSPAPPPARSGATSAAEDAIARGGDGVPAVGLEGANPAARHSSSECRRIERASGATAAMMAIRPRTRTRRGAARAADAESHSRRRLLKRAAPVPTRHSI
jgi:hypothetical protein